VEQPPDSTEEIAMDEQSRATGTLRSTDPAAPSDIQPGARPGQQAGYVAVDESARRVPPGTEHAAGPAYGPGDSAYGPAAGTEARGAAYGPAGGTDAHGAAYGAGDSAYGRRPDAAAGGGAAYPPGGYGDPSGEEPRPKRRVSKAVVAAVAAAAVVVAGGVGFAATRNGNAATSQQAGPGGGFGRAGGPGGGFGGAGLGAIAHGEVVVADSSGTYATRLVQTGTVSAASTTSITVRSADGYSATYTLGSDTSVDNGTDAGTDIATGHTVTVLASTGKAAVTVTDQDLFAANGGQGGPPALNGQNAQPSTGATN
jgi:hypothetical protein